MCSKRALARPRLIIQVTSSRAECLTPASADATQEGRIHDQFAKRVNHCHVNPCEAANAAYVNAEIEAVAFAVSTRALSAAACAVRLASSRSCSFSKRYTTRNSPSRVPAGARTSRYRQLSNVLRSFPRR